MRVKCLQRELSHALTLTSKAVDSNSTLPVLNNVFLKAEGSKLHLISTNLEMAIEYSIETQVINEGEMTLPSKLFTQYVGYLKPDEEIEINTEAQTTFINTSDSKTTIKGIDSSEFPPIPTVERSGVLRVNGAQFKQAIHQVIFSAAMNTTRPILSGVYFFVEGDQLKMVTTDSYRLSERSLSVKVEGGVNCVIPARALLDLESVLDALNLQQEDEVEVVISKNQVMFTFGSFKLTSRLIEGQFPNYQQILPKEKKTTLTCDRSELTTALKRVNLFAKQNNNKVVLHLNEGKLLIQTEGTQYGQGEVELTCKIEGESNQIALNSQYILDVLSGAMSSTVIVELNEKTTPAVFKSEQGNHYLHIIMPLKL